MNGIIDNLVKIELWLYKSIGLGIYEKIETKRQNRYIKLLYKNDQQAQEEYKRKNMTKDFSSCASIRELKEHKRRTYLRNIVNTAVLFVGPLFIGPILVTGATSFLTIIFSVIGANLFISAFYDNFLQRKKRIAINKEIKKRREESRNQENNAQQNSQENQQTREQGIEQMLEPVLQQERTNEVPAQNAQEQIQEENVNQNTQEQQSETVEQQTTTEQPEVVEEYIQPEEVLSSPIKVKYRAKKRENKAKAPNEKVNCTSKCRNNEETYSEYKRKIYQTQQELEREQGIETRRERILNLINTKEIPTLVEKDEDKENTTNELSMPVELDKEIIPEETQSQLQTVDLVQFYRDLREELKKEYELPNQQKGVQKVKVRIKS